MAPKSRIERVSELTAYPPPTLVNPRDFAAAWRLL
jgi:hypothetical protein